MSKVWEEVKNWGHAAMDGLIDFFTFGAGTQVAQEAKAQKYEKARNKAKAILNKIEADQIDLNQLKDALINKKSDLFNSLMNASPFGRQYENIKIKAKKAEEDLKQTDSINKKIHKEYQKANNQLEKINKLENESGLINQITNKIPNTTYDSSYTKQLSDMANRIK